MELPKRRDTTSCQRERKLFASKACDFDQTIGPRFKAVGFSCSRLAAQLSAEVCGRNYGTDSVIVWLLVSPGGLPDDAETVIV
jgi:hypothetical protein